MPQARITIETSATVREFNAVLSLFDSWTAGLFDTASPERIYRILRGHAWGLGVAGRFQQLCRELGYPMPNL